MGRTGFVAEYELWSDQDLTEAERVVRLIEENRLEVIRLSYPDQHGILRGKTIMASEAEQAMRNGCGITTTLLAKDTSHTTYTRPRLLYRSTTVRDASTSEPTIIGA